MSNVVNEPKTMDPEVLPVRNAFEHRALWMYLLLKEAEKKGLTLEEVGVPAISENGRQDGEKLLAARGKTLEGLYDIVFTPLTQKVFDMTMHEHDAKHMNVDFHYCPLVKAWQKQGASDEEIARLCDIAMCGDHNIAKAYGGKLELPQCIAKGDAICELRFSIED